MSRRTGSRLATKIALPVVLRNYLDHKLQLNVTMKPSNWFSATGPTSMKTEVAARDSAPDIFKFKATAATKDGKQEVDAIGPEASDAISKSVTVRPDGEERTESVSQVFTTQTSLALSIPANAISGSLETTLKIYPNLNAHVLESIEAILRRPYGCGEQTISSTYPSVLLLKYAKGTTYEKSADAARARRYVGLGYQRLLSYRAPSGGFSYWGKGDADLALTAYAVRFLNDASEFVAVDPSVIDEALSWLVKQAKNDHWVARTWDGKDDAARSSMLTAYITRVLATSKFNGEESERNAQATKSAASALSRALTYLATQIRTNDEPYAIASYALAAQGAGEDDEFRASVARAFRELGASRGHSELLDARTQHSFLRLGAHRQGGNDGAGGGGAGKGRGPAGNGQSYIARIAVPAAQSG